MADTLTKQVPKTALKLSMGELEFAAGDPTTETQGKFPIQMRARGGQPLYHWYWGNVVHDMAGFSPDKPVIPIDWCHTDELLGSLDAFTPSNDGLDCAGNLVQFKADDRVAEMRFKRANGVPYQASIFFDPKVIEEVMPGATAEVNGFQLPGPGIIIRKWSLRGLAVCPYGYDNMTESKFSNDDQGVIDVPFTRVECQMATDPKPPLDNTATPPTAPTAPVQFTKADAKAELKKFVTRFGAENGAKWYDEDVSFEAALELHISELQNQLKAKDEVITGLQQKLAAAKTGETEPVQFTDNEKPTGSSGGAFSNLGDNLSKFAAGIKLPGKK